MIVIQVETSKSGPKRYTRNLVSDVERVCRVVTDRQLTDNKQTRDRQERGR